MTSVQEMNYSLARIVWSIIIGAISALVIAEAVRLLLLYRSVKGNQRYWNERASEASTPDEFLYVALGDSVAQSIGASRPKYGYVGLIEQHIERSTGRHVRVINVSSTGATTETVLREQLSKIAHLEPDLVTLDIGANDLNKKVPDDTFMRNFTAILDALPKDKSIVSDLPTFERGPKQSTLLRLNAFIHSQIETHQFRVAPIFDTTSATTHDWTTYAADFFHPSSKGHRNWYRAFEAPLDQVLCASY